MKKFKVNFNFLFEKILNLLGLCVWNRILSENKKYENDSIFYKRQTVNLYPQNYGLKYGIERYSVSFDFDAWPWPYRDHTVTVQWPWFFKRFGPWSCTVWSFLTVHRSWPFLTVPDRSWPFLTVHDRFLSFYERLRSFYDLLKTVLIIT